MKTKEKEAGSKDAELKKELEKLKAEIAGMRKTTEQLRTDKKGLESQITTLKKQKADEVAKLQAKVKELEASTSCNLLLIIFNLHLDVLVVHVD